MEEILKLNENGELCLVHRLGLLELIRIVFLPESVIVNEIPIKIPTGFFMESDNPVIWTCKEKPRHSGRATR